ncbi:unnamed protein product [Caenorhabditis bovis]|uniref:HTH TFE/IIEalpha-type domain-containing protein n=1 Tax=Caenorhabditis bovis TaxID=2654633 RepID=A0A8S1F5Y0_9PELO|nr:unnamed protein product [Caenorhabditis bovis]
MATTSNPPISTQNGQPETKVVDEIPNELNDLLLIVVKNFFSNEHYLVVYYIMRAECIREENLRTRLNFDQKMLRSLLVSLKNEKLVKERLLSQKNENGRNVSIIFYFINYRAVLNVVKYKIDHMRQKLESREKNDTNKAHYKCGNCMSTYDMLEINGILDFATGRLTCWRCHGEVTPDESVAPSNLTRTAVARFNEQMAPLFSRIQSLHGIQLAPHLLEPDITKYLEDDKARELQLQQQMDFTSSGQRLGLGGVAHSYNNIASINYHHGDQITVDLNADINKGPVEEAKQVPTWLQDNAIGGSEDNHNDQILSKFSENVPETDNSNNNAFLDLLAACEGGSNDEPVEPEQKRSKVGETQNEEDAEDEDEEEMVYVGGKPMPLSEVTPEMVESEMSEEERQHYTEIVQNMHFF